MPKGRKPGQGFGCTNKDLLSQWGKEGGLATLAQHGREHYRRLGRATMAKQLAAKRARG